MKLFNIQGLMMWFHYGNCKQEIEKLKQENSEFLKQLPVLLGQIQEQKGILDYAMHEKEQEIEKLTKRNIELEEWGKRLAIDATQELTGNRPQPDKNKQQQPINPSIREAWENGDINKLRIVKKVKK